MITGYIKKRSETDYVVNCDAQGNGGYNVVPREIDPYNIYTIEQVEAYLAGHPDHLLDMEAIVAENLGAQMRSIRDSMIQAVEWRVTRHQDEMTLGLEPTEDIIPILEYIQDLRDVPQQEGFPTDIIWPILEGVQNYDPPLVHCMIGNIGV